MSTIQPLRSEAEVATLLERVGLFQDLPRKDLQRIARLSSPRLAEAGELLFREGDPGASLFVICSGSVEILKERPLGRHLRIAVRGPGETVGELALFTGEPRATTVRALEQTELRVVRREQFDELLGSDSLAVRMLKGIARNLYALDERLVALKSANVDLECLRDFSRAVQRTLLPASLPALEGYQCIGTLVSERGGEGETLWDAIPVPGGGGLLCILTVRGLGMPPGHLLGVSRALLREIGSNEPECAPLLTRLNRALAQNTTEALDECVETAVLSLSRERASYCIAGEASAWLVRSDGELQSLESHGPPLGILPRFEYGAGELDLGPGDLLLFCSEAEPRLIRGAAELVRELRAEPAEDLASLLHDTATRALQSSTAQELAFLLVKRL